LFDPSGYSWLSDNWRTLLTAAVAITVSAITMGSASTLGMAMLAGATGGFAGGVTGALLTGANLGQAFKAGIIGGAIGAASGFLCFASGSVTSEGIKAVIEKTAKHAFSNAWLNGITGGNMKHGFISGGMNSLGNQLIDIKVHKSGGKIIAAAVVGGTLDEIGGGKFANGAITGAYQMMFNEMMHGDGEDPPKKAANGEDDWQLVGTGLTSDFTATLPIGFAFESGIFKHEGVEYSIFTLGFSTGVDLSIGLNHIRTRVK